MQTKTLIFAAEEQAFRIDSVKHNIVCGTTHMETVNYVVSSRCENIGSRAKVILNLSQKMSK